VLEGPAGRRGPSNGECWPSSSSRLEPAHVKNTEFHNSAHPSALQRHGRREGGSPPSRWEAMTPRFHACAAAGGLTTCCHSIQKWTASMRHRETSFDTSFDYRGTFPVRASLPQATVCSGAIALLPRRSHSRLPTMGAYLRSRPVRKRRSDAAPCRIHVQTARMRQWAACREQINR
jgi:hypothetical protein